MDLRGKKVIVTGGARGLGRKMVDAILAKDAVVAIFDIDSSGFAKLREHYEHVIAAIEKYHSKFGSADVLINNAGILYSAPLIKITPSGILKHDVSSWNKVLETNLSSVFYLTSCVVEKMILTRTKGVIVNISSVSASGNAGQSAYSAAKAGVNALTATWAKELGSMGIRVVAVAPGFMETDSTKEALSDSVLQEIIKKVPLRRLGKPEEIARGVISVIENDFFNGKIYELDGGLVL
jgi:3-oxoacyl-[acyl-carrier protein] reductase